MDFKSEFLKVFKFDMEEGRFYRRSTGKEVGSRTSHGYLQIQFRWERYRSHHLVWFLTTGEWPTMAVDHIDGNKSNNRPGNLRLATAAQNIANSAQRKNKIIPLKGVSRRHKGRGWMARIRVDGKLIYIGTFDSPELAHEAYASAAKIHFKEFARTQ